MAGDDYLCGGNEVQGVLYVLVAEQRISSLVEVVVVFLDEQMDLVVRPFWRQLFQNTDVIVRDGVVHGGSASR